MKNLAIIPVKAQSNRLPNKNTRDFFGQPIFIHTLDYAMASGVFDNILVSTESDKVRQLCGQYGHTVPFLRPLELATDDAQLVDVCLDALGEYKRRGRDFDNFCILWATAPMRTDLDIRAALKLLDDETDAVVGVTDFYYPPLCAMEQGANHFISPMFPRRCVLPNTKLPRTVVDNGSLCWVTVKAFKAHKTWMPPKLRGYWMPRERSVDIDTEEDWKLAEYYQRREKDAEEKRGSGSDGP